MAILVGVSVADPTLEAVVERLDAAGCVAADEEAAEFLAAWITNALLFCGQSLHMAPGVYVPRSQSEELARRAATLLPDHGRAVDLCTGAGAVAAHLIEQVPTASVIGVDIDVPAATCARRNGVPTAVGDLGAPLRRHQGFDVVTAVAPYVPTGELRLLPADVQRYEPGLALDGGSDGPRCRRRRLRGTEASARRRDARHRAKLIAAAASRTSAGRSAHR